MWKAILLSVWLNTWSTAISEPASVNGHLIIELTDIRQARGIVWVGIYNSEATFMIKERAIVEGFDVDRSGTLRLTFPELDYGTYAIALFQDLNSNGELDRNLIGIPSEPYAFSRRPRSKWRLPRFDEIKFEFVEDGQVLPARLRRWWDGK